MKIADRTPFETDAGPPAEPCFNLRIQPGFNCRPVNVAHSEFTECRRDVVFDLGPILVLRDKPELRYANIEEAPRDVLKPDL